ncbi:MAG: N-acetylneuraminate synthase family protein [Bacteroidetes bacterium]|nr:N-acetylneuraminate synthase family protein [Bacteroidota bacterium]
MEIKLKNGRKIGDGNPAYIMAEIGINHNGSIKIAKELIDIASIIGIDAIKFQKRTIDEMYRADFLKMPYIKDNSFGNTYGEHKHFLEFSNEQLFELQEYTKLRNLDFIVSGFDFSGFEFLNNELDVPFHKIASPLVTHIPLLIHVAKYGKPMILSTGMHDFEEVRLAVNEIRKHNKELVVLQCTTSYPTNDEDVNLSVIRRFRNEFDVLVGYSSHDRGVVIPAASVAFGGCFIEKHFTLDRTMKGPDHVASVEPRGMELIVSYTRSVEKALGVSIKNLAEPEIAAKSKYGYSCVAKHNISKNTEITMDIVSFKVPGTGLSPAKVDLIIGKKLKRDLLQDQEILLDDVD